MVGAGSSTLSLNITRLTSKPLYSGCSARGNSLASMVQQLSAYHRNNDPLDFTVAPTEDHLFPESKANGECNGGASSWSYIRFSGVLLISIPSSCGWKLGGTTAFFWKRCRKHVKFKATQSSPQNKKSTSILYHHTAVPISTFHAKKNTHNKYDFIYIPPKRWFHIHLNKLQNGNHISTMAFALGKRGPVPKLHLEGDRWIDPTLMALMLGT